MRNHRLFVIILFLFALSISPDSNAENPVGALSQTSSFNPVGSGARAVGMGGAFIGMADDATAASWNPGGLGQLKLAEFSLITSCFHLSENINFGTNPEGSGNHSGFKFENINYLSLVFPFEMLHYGMVVALTNQRLYDFFRDWEFKLYDTRTLYTNTSNYIYEQDGGLSAFGISYCINIKPPELSFGFTLNFWDDQLTNNSWNENYSIKTKETFNGKTYTSDYIQKEHYKLKGFNINFGFLWRINKQFQIGAVVKTPFTADIEHHFYSHDSKDVDDKNEVRDEKLSLPLSYGLGIAYMFSKLFHVTADIYRTEWEDYIYTNLNGKEFCPITAKQSNQSDIDPTHQVRLGLEYLLEKNNYTIPLRCGLFYDPAPANKNPDDYYGFSLGAGLVLKEKSYTKKNKRFSVDFAYQFRFGNNVGTSWFEVRDLNQKIREHKFYMSLIIYTF